MLHTLAFRLLYTLDICMDCHLGSSPLNHCHLTQQGIIVFVSYRFDHMTTCHHGILPTQAPTPLFHQHHSFLIIDAMSPSCPEIQAGVLLTENQTPKAPTFSLHYASMTISESCRYKHIKCPLPY